MSKPTAFIKEKWVKVVLLVVSGALSQPIVAKIPVANTPVNQSDYEPLHQGRIQVKASLFYAPCNLSFEKILHLSGCGAGENYHEMNLFDAMANTPVSLKFYDPRSGLSSVRYPVSLLNGSNPIHLPILMEDEDTLRLEVNYE